MDDMAGREPLTVDLVYANAAHPENIFGVALYRTDAKLWMHKDLAQITIRAARNLHTQFGWTLELKDCLRTVDAQTGMQETEIVRKNPHWCEEPDLLLSKPGNGAHPRGMAVDVCVLDANGKHVDMGTPFDYFSEDPVRNPAHRNYTDLPEAVLQNRRNLENAFAAAAEELSLLLFPLPEEWWDFRFPPEIYETYAPLRDKDLPAEMQMSNVAA